MRRFADIVGQEHLKEHLENAIKMDKVSHAYIINGEKNAGKEFIAKTFAMALQCENRQGTEPVESAIPAGRRLAGITLTLFSLPMKSPEPLEWTIYAAR